MKCPSFPFYVNNWFGSERVSAMEPEQEGAYVRLLCYQWNSDQQSIPSDDQSLAKMSRLNGRWGTMGAAVRACFDAVADLPGRLRNERLHRCWLEAQDYREKQRAKGIASGKARAEQRFNRGSTGSEPEGNSESEIESESDLDTEKPEKHLSGRPDSVAADFSECWALYPDQSGKTKALAAYRKARKEGVQQADVLAGLNRYIAYVQHRQRTDFPDLKYKNGATWFNQRGWVDEYTIVKRQGLGTGGLK